MQFRPSSCNARETKVSLDCELKFDKGFVSLDLVFTQHMPVVKKLMRI